MKGSNVKTVKKEKQKEHKLESEKTVHCLHIAFVFILNVEGCSNFSPLFWAFPHFQLLYEEQGMGKR